jgi:hypothetical protein
MSKDWGHRLQNEAYKVIHDDVGRELRKHLNEWKIYTNDLVLFARRAVNRFEEHLKEIKRAIEIERQRDEQLAMFVLSLVSGPALSFVSGALQYRVAERLFGRRLPPKPPPIPEAPKPLPNIKPDNLPSFGHGPDKRAYKVPPLRQHDLNAQGYKHQKDVERHEAAKKAHEVYDLQTANLDPNSSKVKGKILGDLGSSLITHWMLLPGVVAKRPNQANEQNAINRVPDSLDLEELQTNLDNAWLGAQTSGDQAIGFFANMFWDDSAWGDRLLKNLATGRVMGAPRVFGEGEGAFKAGKDWIQAMVNQQRETWAKQDGWFYYGNAPQSISEPHFVRAVETELWAKWITAEGFRSTTKVKRFGDRGRNAEIIPYESFDDPVGGSGVELNRIVPKLRELGVLAAAGNDPWLNPVEVKDVSGNVDTKAELESITNWAKHRKPVIFGGKLRSVKRDMGKLAVTGTEEHTPSPSVFRRPY